MVAKNQHGLVDRGNGFFQAEIRRITRAQQLRGQDVVVFEHLDHVLVAHGGLIEEVDELQGRLGDRRQIFDFGDQFVSCHR